MSNPVTAASTTAATTAQPARAAAARKSTGASFAEVHAAAVRTSKDQDTKADTTATKTPKGEKTEKVDGHHYAEIVAGPRNGMFINTSDNARSGQAFVMVKRDGRQFHIYGSGDDRKVFEVGREPHRTKTTAPPTSASTPAVT
jgi:hypothetical protein